MLGVVEGSPGVGASVGVGVGAGVGEAEDEWAGGVGKACLRRFFLGAGCSA